MEIKLNKHYWALTKEHQPQLLVVICTDADTDQGCFDVCGAWEGPIVGEELVIIEEIINWKISAKSRKVCFWKPL